MDNFNYDTGPGSKIPEELDMYLKEVRRRQGDHGERLPLGQPAGQVEPPAVQELGQPPLLTLLQTQSSHTSNNIIQNCS